MTDLLSLPIHASAILLFILKIYLSIRRTSIYIMRIFINIMQNVDSQLHTHPGRGNLFFSENDRRRCGNGRRTAANFRRKNTLPPDWMQGKARSLTVSRSLRSFSTRSGLGVGFRGCLCRSLHGFPAQLDPLRTGGMCFGLRILFFPQGPASGKTNSQQGGKTNQCSFHVKILS